MSRLREIITLITLLIIMVAAVAAYAIPAVDVLYEPRAAGYVGRWSGAFAFTAAAAMYIVVLSFAMQWLSRRMLRLPRRYY